MFVVDPKSLKEQKVTLGRVFEGSEVLIIADYIQTCAESLVYVARDESALHQTVQELSYLFPHEKILPFPAWDCLPYDRISPRKDILGERAATLAQIAMHNQRNIVITTLSALIQRVPPRSAYQHGLLTLTTGQSYALDDLSSQLNALGYQRLSTVHEPGEYAIRGGLLDLFPSDAQSPHRLDFFGDQIETIKCFDALTQRTTDTVSNIILSPTGEVTLTPQTIETFRKAYRERFPKNLEQDPLYQSVSAGKSYHGVEHWLPLFYEGIETLFSYLESVRIIFSGNSEEALKNRYEHIYDYYQARIEFSNLKQQQEDIYHALPPEELYIPYAELEMTLTQQTQVVYLSAFESPDATILSLQTVPSFNKGIQTLKEYFKEMGGQGKKVHVALSSEGMRHRLENQLYEEEYLKFQKVRSWDEALQLKSNLIALHVWGLHRGVATPNHIFLSEDQVYGEQKHQGAKKTRRADLFIAEASALKMADLVVHQDHGIGRYDGLHTLNVNQINHDCLRLIYDGDDKLFLPVENLDVISRYGGEDSTAQLDKLGSASWQARKAKVKKRLEEIAGHLIEIAAARELKTADVFHVPTATYPQFTDRFKYVETDDQQRAIEETLQSLAEGKPMDRLICGDVGFGKTEVAMRAAYVVATHGVQVAIVTPTTLLCRQHYNSFSQRFEGMGLRVEQLSRLVKSANAKQIKEDLMSGKVDIIIGTHALLGQDIQFAHLGLVIVDEEQHFGVKQKEKLKELQKGVHVLTLTATPIPRTLQMALTGVRDMSIIATPPIDRLAVRTFVTPYDPLVIKEAVHREMHRGGQIFYVCPRVKDLPEALQKLEKIDPSLRIGVAHGQMPPRQLEEVMDAFVDRKYDVLLATNIIESGIDIPSVNTIFVHRSDLFGLSQLYQLRGRIGRGKVRGYAYLTLPPHQILSTTAQKRLEVMQALDILGAGFQIASHDMDIRGAGNLLGQEQSGHVREVGVELYQQMLKEAVENKRHAQGERQNEETWSPQIHFGIPVLIPDTYVSDLSVRLELYRRLARLTESEELQDFECELIDRFGPLPVEVDNLLRIMTLKQLCRRTYIEKLDVGDKGVVLSFRKNVFPHAEKLIDFIQKQPNKAYIRPDQKVVLSQIWQNPAEQFIEIKRILEEIAKFA